MSHVIELVEDVRSPVSHDVLAKHLRQILDANFHQFATVEVLMTTDAKIQELNRIHRAKDTVTDVLSFPTAIDSEQGLVVPELTKTVYLGTIVISIPQAKRQIGHFGQDLSAEVLGLAEHGLRHLLGHDHDEDGQWKE
ncbi:rRNA maturation RNase YbeY [Candidatus Berkelbacteria bacterium]|nr:rRNA maturation RNase YbeY [Candidatus Berkelbacteria bacterium]